MKLGRRQHKVGGWVEAIPASICTSHSHGEHPGRSRSLRQDERAGEACLSLRVVLDEGTFQPGPEEDNRKPFILLLDWLRQDRRCRRLWR